MKSIKDSGVLNMLDMVHSEIFNVLNDSERTSRIVNKNELLSVLLVLKTVIEELESLGFTYKR